MENIGPAFRVPGLVVGVLRLRVGTGVLRIYPEVNMTDIATASLGIYVHCSVHQENQKGQGIVISKIAGFLAPCEYDFYLSASIHRYYIP